MKRSLAAATRRFIALARLVAAGVLFGAAIAWSVDALETARRSRRRFSRDAETGERRFSRDAETGELVALRIVPLSPPEAVRARAVERAALLGTIVRVDVGEPAAADSANA